MPIPKNTLTLRVYEPDNVTLIEGAWRIWLETEHGLAINDAGNGIGGSQTVITSSGAAVVDLPDTTNAGFDPQNAYYKAAFASTDRRVRVKSQPFHMDRAKNFDDIMVVTDLPVTPSMLAQTEAARDTALAAVTAAEAILSAVDIGELISRSEVEALIAAEVLARNAAIQAILDAIAADPGPALLENVGDPGTYSILLPGIFAEDPADPGTYTYTGGVTEDATDAGTYLIGA